MFAKHQFVHERPTQAQAPENGPLRRRAPPPLMRTTRELFGVAPQSRAEHQRAQRASVVTFIISAQGGVGQCCK